MSSLSKCAVFALAVLALLAIGGHAQAQGSGTINQLNPWITSGSQIRLASSTAALRVPSLTNCDTIDTDSNGVFLCGSDGGGGGAGSGTVGTTTALVAGQVAFSTGVATIGNDSDFLFSTSLNRLTVPYASTTAISVGSDFVSDLDGAGLTITSGILNCDTASGSAAGCLSSTDWTTFNNKVSSTSLSVTDSATLDLTYTSGTGVFTGSIVADSVGDTQLAFNTGQNLTTASSPTFSALTLSGLSDGCLQSTTGVVSSTGSACGSGGGGGSAYPFTTATTFGTTTSATTTPLWLQGNQYSLFASSTAILANTQLYTNSSNALAVGPTGSTNPLFRIDASTASAAAGFTLTGSAAGGTPTFSTNHTGMNGSLTFANPGLGTFTLDQNAGGGTIAFEVGNTQEQTITSSLTLIPTNNLGVGTTTAGTALSVGTTLGANITGSSATSTFGGPLRSPCFTTDGTSCITGGGGGSGTVGSGTTGQLPYYAGAGTTLTATSTIFIDTASRTGISSSTPNKTLSVGGEAFISATTTTYGMNVIGGTGTSTGYIYSKTAGFGGRFILEDSDAAGCTEVYALNGVLTAATITCPTEI